MSRAIEVIDGGKLLLRRVHVVNGNATHAGGVLVEGAGSALVMEGASVRDSVATDPWGDDSIREGGGGGHPRVEQRPARARGVVQWPPHAPVQPKGPADCGGALRAVPRLYRWARRALWRERRAGGEHDCRLSDA